MPKARSKQTVPELIETIRDLERRLAIESRLLTLNEGLVNLYEEVLRREGIDPSKVTHLN